MSYWFLLYQHKQIHQSEKELNETKHFLYVGVFLMVCSHHIVMMIKLFLRSLLRPFTFLLCSGMSSGNHTRRINPIPSTPSLYCARLHVTLKVVDYSAPPGLCVMLRWWREGNSHLTVSFYDPFYFFTKGKHCTHHTQINISEKAFIFLETRYTQV